MFVTDYRMFLPSHRNASAVLSCLEILEYEKNSDAYIIWLAFIGIAEANVYMCSSSELRRGKIGLLLKHLQ